jgi:signal transduction histidine kinase
VSKRLPENGGGALLKKTQSMSDLIDQTVQAVRKISAELRPGILDDLGLTAAIEWQTQDFQERTGIQCEFISSREKFSLNQDGNSVVFRIFQETLTNVTRHAQATRVKVRLDERLGTFIMEVRDNGRGITEKEIADPKSLGLMGMRERARIFGGDLEIKGVPGKGTTVTVKIPRGKATS